MRAAIVNKVLELAKESVDYLDLLKKLSDPAYFDGRKAIGPLKQICKGKGDSRKVYLLPEGLVLKVCYSGNSVADNQNIVELEMAGLFPDDTPKVLTHYISPNWIGSTPPRGINILISEYADMPEDIMYDPRLHSEYARARRAYFQKTFADCQDDEVGFIDGRIVAVDLGRDCKKYRGKK